MTFTGHQGVKTKMLKCMRRSIGRIELIFKTKQQIQFVPFERVRPVIDDSFMVGNVCVCL